VAPETSRKPKKPWLQPHFSHGLSHVGIRTTSSWMGACTHACMGRCWVVVRICGFRVCYWVCVCVPLPRALWRNCGSALPNAIVYGHAFPYAIASGNAFHCTILDYSIAHANKHPDAMVYGHACPYTVVWGNVLPGAIVYGNVGPHTKIFRPTWDCIPYDSILECVHIHMPMDDSLW
jgi:hypothetical protein